MSSLLLLAFEVTLPIAIGVGVLAVAALVVGGLWLLHGYHLRAALRESEEFKQQVMSLSDKIDALKERHKLLPHLDQQFSTPMTGETLAAYQQVAAQLEVRRQQWLKLMDVWEQVEALVKSEWLLGNARARQAREMLRAAAAPSEIAILLQECEAPLDRLQKAREQITTRQQECARAQQQFGQQQQAIQTAGLAISPYQPVLSATQALIDKAPQFGPGDPLATLRCLDEAHTQLQQLNARVATILEQVRASAAALQQIHAVAQLASERRVQGFLLREAGADPDPLLTEARHQQTAAWQALNQGDEKGAGVALDQATALAGKAKQAIESHVAAKASCETEIAARQLAARKLADLEALAQRQQAELARDFLMEQWSTVADAIAGARTSITASQRLLEESIQHTAHHAQRYFLATRLLKQAAEGQQQAEAKLNSIGKRLRELTELRTTSIAEIERVRELSDRVGHYLQTNSADRVRANERYRGASVALERLVEETRLARPDWTRLTARVREIQSDLERAEQMAKEDVQLAQQATAEIDESEKLLREVQSFQDMGYTADVASAQQQLAQARQRAISQDFEAAIQFANQAEHAARAAREQVVARAQQRRQELALERAAQETATINNAPQTLLQAEAEAEPAPTRVPISSQAREF